MAGTGERRQQWEDEEEDPDAPYIGGYSRNELQALPERQRDREYQKVTQVLATHLGYFRTCTLPVCRRAKACRGFLSDAQYEMGGYHSACPPCAGHGAPRHGEIIHFLTHLPQALAQQVEMELQALAHGNRNRGSDGKRR